MLAHSNPQLTSTAFAQRNALHCSKLVHSLHFFSSFTGVRCCMRVQKVRFFSASSFLVCEVICFVRESYRFSCSLRFKMQDVRRTSDSVVCIRIAFSKHKRHSTLLCTYSLSYKHLQISFPAPVQTDPVPHPASCTIGPGGKAADAWR